MKWTCAIRQSVRRDRSRIPAPRVAVTLMHMASGGVIILNGEHGRRVLEAIADRWNAQGFDPPGTITRCAADYSSEAARSKYLTR